jgi:hypothetical protein
MKAISIRQPYASEIMSGKKKNEYRTWRTHFRGKLVICSAANPKLDGHKCGMVLGTAEVVGCSKYRDGWFAWALKNPRPYAKPFKVKGQLGFFNVRRIS